jgi:hypothetical protein
MNRGKMEESSATTENQPVLVQKIKSGCKHCLGRGYERWLSARKKYPDGSVKEEFQEKPCRCIRLAVENV